MSRVPIILRGYYCQWILVPLMSFAWIGQGRAAAPVSFAHEVQPILSDKCYFCHGPDAGKREAGLRLDTFLGATEVTKDRPRPAIVPGKPEESEIIRRMQSKDPNVIMPPPTSHLTMSAEEIARLEEWIRQGAKYEAHWAFTPLPAEVPIPKAGAGWARNPIDHFVAEKWQKLGLKPSAEAAPDRLLRRVSLDLNGLPPTPEAVENAATTPYEKSVDALLASPAYGETMALSWLDAARYADSYGYQSDLLTGQWPWRDWVIRALNENLPYDQFLTWQVAGDLLPNPTRVQILATAFNRLNRMTQEGGSVHEEFRIEGVADRLHTFGTTFLALTMECSRCHDHKYDPISARDYYSLGAFFNSIPERGMYSDASIVPGPTLLLPTEAQEKSANEARAAIQAAESALAAAQAAAPTEWPQDMRQALAAQPTALPGWVARFAFDGSQETRNQMEAEPKSVKLHGLKMTESPFGQAVLFEGDRGLSFPGLLEADWPQAWSVDIIIRDTKANPERVVLWQRTFGTDAGYNGYECLLGNGQLEVRLTRDWPGSALGVRTPKVITPDQWHRVTVTWDGSGKASGLAIYVDGRAQTLETVADSLRQSVNNKTYGSGHFTLGERFRDRGFTGGAVAQLGVFQRALAAAEVQELHEPGSLGRALENNTASLQQVFHAAWNPAAAAAREQLRAARQNLVALETGIHSVAVMAELPQPRPAWILARGEYSAPATAENAVQRDVFAEILPRFPTDQPRNRLGLARWLVLPDHPLTARVYVNRLWQHFFGIGLVATPDNFGFQGSPPSHPELLDWLARDFIASGWDVKRLCRMIVSSATYRQDSQTTPKQRQRDPQNLMLARGPAHRLAAEPIRDLALAASGMLAPKLGGPPVSPYQPGPDLWRESNSMSPAYTQSRGYDLLRRSIYSVWKRTAPLPNATLFDAPSREACVVKRSTTNTPLQALVLLNDPQFIEPSRILAEKLLSAHPKDDDARVRNAFVRLAGRQPDSTEVALLLDLLAEQRTLFRKNPEAAHAFLAIGDFRPELPKDATQKAALANQHAEWAANTVLCQTILNLDAVIWKR